MIWMNANIPFKDFVAQKKNRPGTLIEVLSNNRRKQFLIGDINTFSCVTDGGKPFDEESIVTRYKIIISF
jgi:hypothetical protein